MDVFENNAAECDDKSACTTGDTCQEGNCIGLGNLSCDDGNPCTLDICKPDGGCAYENAQGACDDGDACTVNDSCAEGGCQSGAVLTCEDDNPCTDQVCEDGGCVFTANEAECDDGNACTETSACTGGACVGTKSLDCDDGELCTADSCDVETGCVYVNHEVACNDADPCTVGDICSEGICTAGAQPLPCEDGNVCTDDSCEQGLGCVFTPNAVDCDDGNACTVDESCNQGLCQSEAALECNDENPCTDDTCKPATGCIFTPNAAPCSDGDLCSVGDTCLDGDCVSGNEVLQCDDGVFCNGEESCDAEKGCISGQPPVVDDNVPCTMDTCDEASGTVLHAPVDAMCEGSTACSVASCDENEGCVDVVEDDCCGNGIQESYVVCKEVQALCSESGVYAPFEKENKCPVAYWDMEATDPSTGRPMDYIGGNHLTVYGNPQAGVDGVAGKTYQIANKDSYFVSQSPYPAALQGAASKSLSAWVNLSGFAGDGDEVSPVAGFGGRPSSCAGRAFNLSYSETANYGACFVACSAEYDIYTDIKFQLNTWYHMAATYDGNEVRLYVDGEHVATKALALDTATEFDRFTVGVDSWWGTDVHRLADGRVDEVKAYDFTLSNEEVMALYTLGLEGPQPFEVCEVTPEQCDDGNDAAGDGCDAQCAKEVDGANCSQIHHDNPQLGDGIYVIDPDGDGPVDPFEVYCDMTTDDGGWTVLFNVGDVANDWSYVVNPGNGAPFTEYSTCGPDVSRWTYDGEATQTYVNELDTSGDYSQPSAWSMTFDEFAVGAQAQGYKVASVSGAFDKSQILENYNAPNLPNGGSYNCQGEACTHVPGTVQWPFFEAYYMAFNQVDGSSGSACRLATSLDLDNGANDIVDGFMCLNFDGNPCTNHALEMTPGYRLMGRHAICGNGKQEGSETCDDGNQADGDGCSAGCKSEIRVSCKDWLDNDPSLADGVYSITPPGEETMDVYCDMTTDGGGWTLVAKISANDQVDRWGYDAAIYRDDSILGDPLNLSKNDAKSKAYSTVVGSQVLIQHLGADYWAVHTYSPQGSSWGGYLNSIWNGCGIQISGSADALKDDGRDGLIGNALYFRHYDAEVGNCSSQERAMLAEVVTNAGWTDVGVGLIEGNATYLDAQSGPAGASSQNNNVPTQHDDYGFFVR